MKKSLLVVLAVLMCSMAFAQLQKYPVAREANPTKGINANPTWAHINTPFVANDINGNQVDLAAILNAGTSVVIDYSCTWCNPCWQFHLSGVLEALDEMSNVQVIWVESESRNTTAQIYGPAGGSTYGDATCGNWTVDAQGNPVPYPIIDDDANGTCLYTCYPLYEGYVPSVYLITPSGYFCSLYGESWGVSSSTAPAQACNIVNGLIAQAPQAGQEPIISGVYGPSQVINGNTANYRVEYISVDPISSIQWTFADGNPATATGESVSTTWTNAGVHHVTLAVTNTTGTANFDFDVTSVDCNTINQFPYTMGFEPTDAIGCWTFIDNDGDGYGWDYNYFNGNTNYTHSGSGVVGSASFINEVGALSPDNWMISPAIEIPANETNMKLSWYVGGVDPNYYNENYSVLVSTTGTNLSDFSQVFTERVSSVNFTKKEVNLSAYAGQTIYVAFRHHNCSDVYWMLIDDITLTSGVGINGIDNNVAIYPNPATDKLNVVAEGVKNIEIIDATGRVVLNTKNAGSIDISNLSNGIYMVRTITNEGVSMQKIIKK